jgi:hypothetical protein
LSNILWVPVVVETAIEPKHIQVESPEDLEGIFGNAAYGPEIGLICLLSQGAGRWVGTLHFGTCNEDHILDMIEERILIKERVCNGWLYRLTSLAIEKIYLVQSQRRIEALEGGLIEVLGTLH